MPFIRNYNGIMNILTQIAVGTCSGTCKSTWLNNINHAVQCNTNPWKLTIQQRTLITEKIKIVSGVNAKTTISVK